MVEALMTNDIVGVAAQRVMNTLIEGNKEPYEIVRLASKRLNKRISELIKTLDSELRDRHRFLSKEISSRIMWLEHRIGEINSQVVAAIRPYQEEWHLLRTIPGIDNLCAAMLLAKIGPDYELLWRLWETALTPGSYQGHEKPIANLIAGTKG